MAKEYQGEELWLPSHFLCDAFFLEGGPKNGGETVDDVAGLAQQMARYFLPCAHEDAPVAAPEHAKVESCLSCRRFFFLPPLQIQ